MILLETALATRWHATSPIVFLDWSHQAFAQYEFYILFNSNFTKCQGVLWFRSARTNSSIWAAVFSKIVDGSLFAPRQTLAHKSEGELQCIQIRPTTLTKADSSQKISCCSGLFQFNDDGQIYTKDERLLISILQVYLKSAISCLLTQEDHHWTLEEHQNQHRKNATTPLSLARPKGQKL